MKGAVVYYQPELETMSREELDALQLERLQKLVAYVYERIPFYRESFDEAGVKPEDIKSLDDLRKFPFTVKQDLRDAYPFGGGLHCSTADVYREGECLDYFPNRVEDPTLVRPEMWK